MSCTQQKQLVAFPKVRIQKKWFRYFFDHKEYHNEGTLHLFSLVALYSYANFRTNTRMIEGMPVTEAPGQWICKLGSLPRIMRVHSKQQALELLEYFQQTGYLRYEFVTKETEWVRFEITDWQRHCVHLNYNYYSYKGSGFFFFPLPVGRQLLRTCRTHGKIVFSELDAIADLWLHTILNDPGVRGSEFMPVVYYTDMHGMPLLSYSYLAKRWGWSKSRVGRFILKIEEGGIIGRVSFTSSHGSVITMSQYREMIFGADCRQIEMQRIGEILGLMTLVKAPDETENIEVKVENRVPSDNAEPETRYALRIEVFRQPRGSFFARPVPFIFYSSQGSRSPTVEAGTYRGPPEKIKNHTQRREVYDRL